MKKTKYNLLGGEKFGMFVVLSELPKRDNYRYILCRCECGSEIEIRLTSITSGASKSCGCLTRANDKNNLDTSTHGLSKHPLYKVYYGILRRCYDTSSQRYNDYGGRGIVMCEEWRNSFLSFYNWALANGWQRRLQIDRYPNNDGNYEPSNCRIATSQQNSNNKRNTTKVKFNGENITVTDLARGTNIPRTTLRRKLKNEIPLSEILCQH